VIEQKKAHEKYSKMAFIELAMAAGVLKFGDFTLKSGRQSPYFFNAGLFNQGPQLRALGQFYAACMLASGLPLEQLFGPAYKGLPLATATAIALAEHDVSVTVTFNRKEVKDHGEGGELIGAALSGNIIVVDDVITAGTAFREAQAQIQRHGGKLCGLVIALDRCEPGLGQQSAIAEIEAEGIKVYSIITFYDLVAYLKEHGATENLERMMTYQQSLMTV